jgi:hypothetical protein
VNAIALHVVVRLAAAAVDDMRARYDFGKVLYALRRGAKRDAGAATLRMLAKRLGVHASALRRYARVSETIPPAEFAWLVGLRTPRGAPVTWSHVELLARETDASRRRALTTHVVTEDLSVRALAARLRRSGNSSTSLEA